MKSYHTLALKEILEQKTVSVFILIAVILSTMMTTAVGQSAGVLAAMRKQQAITIGGDRFATFVQLTEQQVQTIKSDLRISYAGRSIPLGGMDLNNLLRLDLIEYRGDSMETYPSYTKLMKGRLPEKAMEIALSEDALAFLGFTGKVGDTISLSLSKALRHGIMIEHYDYTADFVLTGITESNYTGYSFGSIIAIAGEGTADAVLPSEYLYYNVDVRLADKREFQTVMDELIEKLHLHELDTLYNYPYLNALGIPYNMQEDDAAVGDSGFIFLILAGILAAALILLAAGLVIYNILKIAVARRIRHYGILRAIGAKEGQLYRIVAEEILLLCMIGIPAGMLLGFLSAKGILTAALSQLSPEMFLVQDADELRELLAVNSSGKLGLLLFSALITLLSAFLASVPAARTAAKVSPVTAMHDMMDKKIRRRKRNRRKIENFARYYAALNLRRGGGRTVITVLSLVMSITVFIALQGYLSLLDVSYTVPEHTGDYSVVNEYSGFSMQELQDMENDENIKAVAAQQFSMYELDEQYFPVGIETDFALGIGERFQIFGENDYYVEERFTDRLSKEQLAMFKAGEGCIVRNPLPIDIGGEWIGTTHIEEGSTITIAGKKLPVLLSISGYDQFFSIGNNGFINGVQVLVSDRIYPALTGTDTYAELLPVLKTDADRAAFDLVLENLCMRVAGTTYLSYEQADRQLEESAAQIRLLAWGLILLIALIGILNIMNTVYTNILTRVTEIGIQRAIGMSIGTLYKTFLWEGAYYGMIATLIGSVSGYFCNVLIEAAVSETLSLIPIPVLPMIQAAAASVTACLLATAVPLCRISGLHIVEAVEAVE